MHKIKSILLSLFFIVILSSLNAQPDPPGGGHGNGSNEAPGGGVPIGSGLFILLGLGAAYGGKKLYDMNKEELEE